MRTRDVHFTCRAAFRRWLVALPLVVLSLTANANFIARTTHGNFELVRNGKTTELRAPQTVIGAGYAVSSTGTVVGNANSVAAAGTATQGMGATAAGATASAGVNLAGTATVPVNGSTVPVAVKANLGTDVLIPAAISGIGCVQGGVVGVLACAAVGAAVAGAPLAYDWITRAGGRINPETGAFERKDPVSCTVGPCYEWQFTFGGAAAVPPLPGGWYKEKSCPVGFKTYYNGYTLIFKGLSADSSGCLYDGWSGTNTSGAPALANQNQQAFQSRTRVPDGYTNWLPSSMNDIAPYMSNLPVDPGIVRELADRGIELGNPPLQVTGPSSVAGPTTSTTTNNTTNNTSSTVTTNTTNNYTYEGNKVINIGTSITSTTTTKNADGTTSTTGTSTTTTTPGTPAEPPEQKVQCDKYPNSLGCSDLDVPSGDIPKSNKNITFSEEAVLGGGSCPADRLIGQYTFSYAPTCSTITSYVRPLVLMIAGWMAIVIIFSIGKPEA
ncbi:hypothetical protein SAMN05216567_12668 [Variovorax sp. OK605]|uniref:hypothetical protein n=1 Tax=Variovorax sp. OK605 TaxID=1855317 RepID=UPI0008E47D6E|nr:hypothetical protein [Variovorax sp. OK605]SFQ68797.1 hypothetical protein SAMN05216567_12668 [Variovorax sp. OK605]